MVKFADLQAKGQVRRKRIMKRSGKTLVFDADDTLWENNVLFEGVIEEFIDWLSHPTLERQEVRGVLDEIEAVNSITHGYGSAMFLRSLRECFERLRERPATPGERKEIESLAAALVEYQVEPMPGVADTLKELATRYELLLFTKGQADEQRRKIEASGLALYFAGIHIVTEKRVADYQRLLVRQALDPTVTWMIGNSPKSDIIPARAAGMNAVLIPNQNTWVLEHEELDSDDDGVLTLRKFSELLVHF